MATSVKVVMAFTCDDGKNHNFSYKYADPELRTADVRTLVQAIITNGSVFDPVPVSLEGAKLVTTTENEFDLS
ncbi:MAG: DUF2922 family protein [Synergistaceae bacterium]|nr:DUF2922 family protein [Synergistaceae bacterium]